MKNKVKKEENTQFTTKQTSFDPETGQISWDVEYTPLVDLRNEVEELFEAYKKAILKYPDDEKLNKLFEVYSSFKRAFKTHVNRRYGK